MYNRFTQTSYHAYAIIRSLSHAHPRTHAPTVKEENTGMKNCWHHKINRPWAVNPPAQCWILRLVFDRSWHQAHTFTSPEMGQLGVLPSTEWTRHGAIGNHETGKVPNMIKAIKLGWFTLLTGTFFKMTLQVRTPNLDSLCRQMSVRRHNAELLKGRDGPKYRGTPSV